MSRTWRVWESSTTWLRGFPANALPSGLEASLRVLIRNGDFGLEVGGVVGSVPLANGDTLHIAPKVGPANFYRMLLTAEGLFEELRTPFEDFVSYGLEDESSFPQLVANAFVRELREVQSLGLRNTRTKVRAAGPSARGRILPLDTVLRLRLRSELPVVFEERVRDLDVAENRVLAAAGSIAASLIGSAIPAEKEFLQKFGQRFARPRTLQSDLSEINAGLASGRYMGARGYYVRALTFAKLLLADAGLSQDFDAVIGDALVVNTASLFERYVRHQLSERYMRDGKIIQKGGSPGQSLYTDGAISLNPDITISTGRGYVTVGDVKYKSLDAGDHYQLSIYMQNFGVTTGFLLFPALEGGRAGVAERRTSDRRKVYEICLPLDDLDATELQLHKLHEIIPLH